jgi:cytochrome P450
MGTICRNQTTSMSTIPAYRPPKVPVGPDKPSLFRYLRTVVDNPVAGIPAAAYREPVALRVLPIATMAFVTGPDLVEDVLVKRAADFPKSRVDSRLFRPALGDGLLTAEGEDWRWKRRLIAPYFSPAALARSVPDMVAPFRTIAGTWLTQRSEAPIDVSPAMTSATFQVIARTLFSPGDGADAGDEVDFAVLSAGIDAYLEPSPWVIGLVSLNAPAWMPHPGRGRMLRARDRLRSMVGALVSARRRSGVAADDICGDLMRARDPETGRTLSDRDMVDTLLTLIAAGHETSAKALTWALFCLGEQPALQADLAADVAGVTGGRPVEAVDLPRLATVEAFLKETMRLFPPAPLLARRTTRPETLAGHTLKPGTVVFIPIYAIHRHQSLWPDPDRFDHTRFLGDNARTIPRTAHMPFGAGPRVCVGATFAMMEMVAALATLLQHVRFSTVEGTRCEPVHRITLRPKGGMMLKVTPACAGH